MPEATTDRLRLENALLRVESAARTIAMADFDETHGELHKALKHLDATRSAIAASHNWQDNADRHVAREVAKRTGQ